MLLLLRNIRRKLISTDNKVITYLLYAIGEIILVVVGILIAVQIDNAVDNQKKKKLKANYILALDEDLRLDSAMLAENIAFLEKDTKHINQLIYRINHSDHPIDTMISIARDGFSLQFYTNPEMHRSTYQTLISTGNIDLFDKDLNDRLVAHNYIQSKAISVNDLSVGFFIDYSTDYSNKYPVAADGFSRQVQDLRWKSISKQAFLMAFTGLMTAKIAYESNMLHQYDPLMALTSEFRKVLREKYRDTFAASKNGKAKPITTNH